LRTPDLSQEPVLAIKEIPRTGSANRSNAISGCKHYASPTLADRSATLQVQGQARLNINFKENVWSYTYNLGGFLYQRKTNTTNKVWLFSVLGMIGLAFFKHCFGFLLQFSSGSPIG